MGRTKGKEVAGSSQSRVSGIKEHPLVQLISTAQKENFVRLMKNSLLATRFLSRQWMGHLELDDSLQSLFDGTGFGFLYGMAELTYPSLTLEFLSSFNYDFGDEKVTFRLCNITFELSLRAFGNIFGFVAGGLDHAPDSFDYRILWRCMSGTAPRTVSSLRISAIEHPSLRLWFRTLGGTIFGRSEPGNTNKHELEILGSYLNVQRQSPFRLELAHYVATHFTRVARGSVSTIEIGGIVTHIAKRLQGCDVTRYTPIGQEAPFLDRTYITRSLKWHSKEDNYRWKLGDRWINLPCAYLAPLMRLSQAGENEQLPTPSYLIGAPPAQQGGNAQAPPVFEQPLPLPPAQPSYSGHDDARSSFSGSADTQWRIDYQLAQYPVFHDHVLQGHVPPEGPYHSYYTGPEGQYGGYPGRIFDNAGWSQDNWGPSYWNQGGQGSGGQGNNNDGGGGNDE